MGKLADKFAANLKASRRGKRMTQETLAKKAGISVSYVSMLERGERCPFLPTLESIARALSVPAISLLI